MSEKCKMPRTVSGTPCSINASSAYFSKENSKYLEYFLKLDLVPPTSLSVPLCPLLVLTF